MERLETLDVALFRFINQGLSNRFFDWFLPYFDSNVLFVPALLVLGIWLTWKGGVRGRLLACFLLLTYVVGDPIVVDSLKRFFDRSRPFSAFPDIHLLVGRIENMSMPSGHAANWFAATVVTFVYYRRTLWFMLPIASVVAFSRIYLGVHYPSDVLAGSLIGVACAVLVIWGSDGLWRSLGRRWFPIWWAQLPSLRNPDLRPRPEDQAVLMESAAEATRRGGLPGAAGPPGVEPVSIDQHWLRLAYVLIAASLVGHWIYIALGRIQLSEDEAYQWLWSKHLALSYYSKPPLIAYTQFLGTWLWGDNAFGVRFFSPVLGALGSLLLVRLLAHQASGYLACLLVLVTTATPLLMVGSTLMTIDSLSVLFWVAALVSGWRAGQRDSTPAWLWTGLWIGLGFLSKYTGLFQWICWAAFFLLWPPARAQLRRPGPYLAFVVSMICLTPVLIWNAQHDWITLTHLANRGGLDRGWQPTLRFFWDFLLAEAALLNPIFFLATVWAAARFWGGPGRQPFLIYLFSMGAPLFLFYLFYTFRARVQPNWIAPAILPLFCLMLLYWDRRWREGLKVVRHGLIVALALGWIAVASLHDTRLVGKLIGRPLPVQLDPLRRVLGWKEMAREVNQARLDLIAEGKPVFIIASHYGSASLLSFYIPEAKAGVPDNPLVYYLSSDEPKNQFFFWPGYQMRKGENAICVGPVDKPAGGPPANLVNEFASVTSLGVRDIVLRNRVIHRIELFACRDLR